MFIPRNSIPSNDNSILLIIGSNVGIGMIFDMMKNLVLAFLYFQADVVLGIIKTTSDQREVSTKTLHMNLKIKLKTFRIIRNFL